MSLKKAVNAALKEQGESSSELERAMLTHIRQVGLPEPEREFRFKDGRKWAFDFAYPRHKLALEVEGLGSDDEPGRHQRVKGFTNDCRKYSEAAVLGWRIIRVTGGMIYSGEAIDLLQRGLGLWQIGKGRRS